MIDESFLTTEEVLDYLQVNLRTVYRLIKAGKIPAVRVGRQWRFRKRDIDAWLETQRPRGTRATTPVSSARAAVPVAGGRARVLVVDDEATIRDLLSKTLALAEYDVDLAPD
jgi:excisionase family DNA binding protein